MKFKTSHLLLIFIALLSIVIIAKLISERSKSGDLKKEFFSIRLSTVRQFNIIPLNDKSKAFSLTRNNENWFISSETVEMGATDTNYLFRAFKELEKLKPVRLASENKKDWAEYGVDSTGTLLEILTFDNKTYRIILGNLTFQNDQYVNTYVRLPEEESTYAVEAYMEGTFKGTQNEFRKRKIFPSELTHCQTLSIKDKGNWVLSVYNNAGIWRDTKSNQELDSLKIQNLFAAIERFGNSGFTDFKSNATSSPELEISIIANGNMKANVSLFPNLNYYLLSSDLSQNNYFVVDSVKVETVRKGISELK